MIRQVSQFAAVSRARARAAQRSTVCLRRAACFVPARALCSAPPPGPPLDTAASKKQGAAGHPLARYLNHAIEHHPKGMMVAMMLTDMGTIGLAYGSIVALGVDVPANLAAAYVLTRPLKRPRLPLELAAAKLLTMAWPWLSAVKIADMVQSFLPAAARVQPPGPQDPKPSLGKRALNFATHTLNSYGLAYQLGSRAVGLSIVLATFAALQAGVDVGAWLEATFGISTAASDAAGKWAAAVCVSSVAYPASIFVAARLAALLPL